MGVVRHRGGRWAWHSVEVGERYERTSGVERAVGLVPVQGAVGIDAETPAAFVDEVMMAIADRHQVGQLGLAAEVAEPHVVDVAAVEHHGAPGVDAGAVHAAQRTPERRLASSSSLISDSTLPSIVIAVVISPSHHRRRAVSR